MTFRLSSFTLGMIACLLPACTSPEPPIGSPGGAFVEGTQLVAHALYAEGAPALLISAHDSKTDEDCAFRQVGSEIECVSPNHASGPVATRSPASEATTVTFLEMATPDGARFPELRDIFGGTLFDRHWQKPCSLEYVVETGEGQCVPPYAADYGFFADTACATRIGASQPGEPPVVMKANDGSFFEVGPEFTGPVFQGGPGSCSVIDPPITDFRYFSRGAPMASSEITSVRLVYQGAGRLKLLTLENEGKTVAMGSVIAGRDQYRDTLLDETCTPVRSPEGIRCFTGDIRQPSGAFADPACTQPAVEPQAGDSVAFEEPGAAPSDGIARVSEIWRTDPHAKPLTKSFVLTDGVCGEAPLGKVSLFAVTSKDDWSRYAPLQERIGSRVVSQ